MASTCPNCGKKLHWYDVKAECSSCGISIPNYNWEQRLEADNELAEKKFATFYRGMNRLAYSIWGTKLRIARIILSVLPAIGFILPWSTLKSDTVSIGLDLFGITSDKSLLDLFGDLFGNMNLYFTNMAYENYAGVLSYSMFSLLLMVLSLLFAVIAFFMILILAKKSRTKVMTIFECLSVLSAVGSQVTFMLGIKAASTETAVNFGSFSVYNPTGGVAWGFFVALALLLVAVIVNALVAKAPAKSDEELESERLARKNAKEEKEREAEIRREKERLEEEKRQQEEQAAIVEKAKAALAVDKNKKK